MPGAAALRPILGLASVPLLGGLFLVAGCSKEAPPPKPVVVDVTALTVQAKDAPVIYEFVGQTQSSREVEIRARVDGFLEKRVYNEGTLVKEGATLFLMDSKPFEAALQQARGELAQQQARLQVAVVNLARVKPLAEQNAVSQKDLDDAVGNEKSTRAAVLTAQGAVRQAELSLSYTKIASPLTGLSSFAKIQDGAYINATNNLLTTVAQLDPMWVNFSVSENEELRRREAVAKKQVMLPPEGSFDIEVVLADGSVFPDRGKISFADPSFSKETGTFLVRATFANPKGTLKPGQFVRVNVLGATRPNAILVPQRAVQQGAKSHFVWVVGKDGKAEQRVVETGQWLGDDWVISQGLQAGEQVIVDGAIRVGPGAQLKVTAYSPPKPAPEAAVKATAEPSASEKGRAGKDKAAKKKPAKEKAAEDKAVTDKAGKATPAPEPVSKKEPPAAADGARPRLPAKVHFAFRQTALDDTAKSAIADVAAALKDTQDRIEVTGYSDSKGAPERNNKVATARASAVRDALVAAGIAQERISLQKPEQVVGSGDDAEARRVEIRLSAAR